MLQEDNTFIILKHEKCHLFCFLCHIKCHLYLVLEIYLMEASTSRIPPRMESLSLPLPMPDLIPHYPLEVGHAISRLG